MSAYLANGGEISAVVASGEQPETRTTSELYREAGPAWRPNTRVAETAHDFAQIYDEPGPGVDVPGVGHVSLSDSPSPKISPDRTGRGAAVDEVPLPLRNLAGGDAFAHQRECLFVELLFAANELAHAQIEPATPDEARMCTECIAEERDGTIEHERTCHVGRVQRVIHELCAIARPFSFDVDPNEKEAAVDGETPAAGDGIRPHGHTWTQLVTELNEVLRHARTDSDTGIERMAVAMASVLNIRAREVDMDAQATKDFRKYFAEIVMEGGL